MHEEAIFLGGGLSSPVATDVMKSVKAQFAKCLRKYACHPHNHDFFLVSQAGLIGTSRLNRRSPGIRVLDALSNGPMESLKEDAIEIEQLLIHFLVSHSTDCEDIVNYLQTGGHCTLAVRGAILQAPVSDRVTVTFAFVCILLALSML